MLAITGAPDVEVAETVIDVKVLQRFCQLAEDYKESIGLLFTTTKFAMLFELHSSGLQTYPANKVAFPIEFTETVVDEISAIEGSEDLYVIDPL